MDSRHDRKAQGCIFPTCSDRCERTAPIPSLDASTSTTNCHWGSGIVRICAVVKRVSRLLKAASASGDQDNRTFEEVSACSGAAIALKPLMNSL